MSAAADEEDGGELPSSGGAVGVEGVPVFGKVTIWVD